MPTALRARCHEPGVTVSALDRHGRVGPLPPVPVAALDAEAL